MKYIRTKDGIYKNKPLEKHIGKGRGKGFEIVFKEQDIIKRADTIEELCDEFVLFRDDKPYAIVPNKGNNAELSKNVWKDYRGAIWTDKGLIYVAKMNEKGELELL